MNYNAGSKLVMSFNYTRTNDVFTYIYALETQADASKIWASSMGNLNKANNYSLNLNAPFGPVSWWKSNNNILFYYLNYNSAYNGGYLNNRKVVVNFNSSHTLTLSKSLKAELSGSFNSRSLYGFHVTDPHSSINLGLQKTFLNKKAKASLNVSDLFNQTQWSSNMNFNNIHVRYYNKWETRLYRLSFSYQFGKNTVKPARQRKSGNEEERKRVENN
jgi:hypothetical protein